MTTFQVIVAIFVIIGLAATIAGLIIASARALKPWADRVEQRQRAAEHQELVDRCNVYRLHPATIDEIRPRRGDAA